MFLFYRQLVILFIVPCDAPFNFCNSYHLYVEPLRGSFEITFFLTRVSPGATNMSLLRSEVNFIFVAQVKTCGNSILNKELNVQECDATEAT